jgi:hypothetical protein
MHLNSNLAVAISPAKIQGIGRLIFLGGSAPRARNQLNRPTKD